MEHYYSAELDTLRIRPLAVKDLELLRSWRNDPYISRYFRKIEYITSTQQRQWFKRYLEEAYIYYWTIEEESKPIGSLSLYDIRESEGVIGKFMIGDPTSHGKGYGYKAFIMALKVGFEQLQLENIKVTVHEKNIPAKRIYELIGFEVIDNHPFNEEGDELDMIIDRNTFKEVNPMAGYVRLSENRGGCRISNILATFNCQHLEVA